MINKLLRKVRKSQQILNLYDERFHKTDITKSKGFNSTDIKK